eukprot:gene6880-11042_t
MEEDEVFVSQLNDQKIISEEEISDPDSTSSIIEKEEKNKENEKTSTFVELFNIILLGLSFMLIFSAFNTTANYMSTLHQDIGYISLGLLYFIFSLSNFFSPTIEKFVGSKICMIAGSLVYILYVLFAGFNFAWLLIVFSIFLGFAASILWTAQGNYISSVSSEDKLGFNSGLFFGLFFLSIIFGNLIVGVLFSFDIPLWMTFLILFCIGLVGIVMLFFIKNPKIKKEKKINILQSILNSIKILFNSKMILLLGFCFYSGFSQSLFSGKIPEIIGTKLGKDYVGYTMSCFGLSEFIGSLTFGRLIDKLGIKMMMMISFCFHLIALFFTLLLSKDIMIFYFISTTLNGLADSSLNPTLYSILGGRMFQKEGVSNAFASFKLVQSLSYAFGYFSSIYFQLYILQIMAIVILLISLLMFVILDLMIESVDSRE